MKSHNKFKPGGGQKKMSERREYVGWNGSNANYLLSFRKGQVLQKGNCDRCCSVARLSKNMWHVHSIIIPITAILIFLLRLRNGNLLPWYMYHVSAYPLHFAGREPEAWVRDYCTLSFNVLQIILAGASLNPIDL